ncbi:MAG: hypothetical protein HY744_06815, partial [Deltaproteobacteria bacterium]|nr:hypothetical protein [Deltaproteobacteria bacterium]
MTGDGVADSAQVLGSLGITDAERQELALRYPVGKSLWRSALAHFSAWDCNWSFWPPPDAAALGSCAGVADSVTVECKSESGGAVVVPMSQAAGRREPVAGTPYELVYQSDRTLARDAERKLAIPLSEASVPPSPKRIDLEVSVAGRTLRESFPPLPEQTYAFEWDGKDAFGRFRQGVQPVAVRVGFVYEAVYQRTNRFGYNGNGTPITMEIGTGATRWDLTLWCESTARMRAADAEPLGLGGWSLDVHHWYDVGDEVHLGDGTVRKAEAEPAIVETFAGGGATPAATGVEALKASLPYAGSLATGADGSVYVVTDNGALIFRIGPDGLLTHVAGVLPAGYNGDEIPATQARLNGVTGIALGSGCAGGIYVADNYNHRIRHIDQDGIIHTVAGTGHTTPTDSQAAVIAAGDGGPAALAEVASPYSVAVGPDGSVYFTSLRGRVGRIGTDGLMSTAAGRICLSGDPCLQVDGVPATQSGLLLPSGVAVGQDGALYILEGNLTGGVISTRIRRVGVDGIIETFAGGGLLVPAAGQAATSANINWAGSMALAADGVVYFTHSGKLWAVDTDGALRHIAGRGCTPYACPAGSGNGVPAPSATLMALYGGTLAVGPDRAVYLSDSLEGKGPVVRRVRRPLPAGAAEHRVPSEDGRELFLFSNTGRHLETRDALTGALRYAFSYDLAGRLASVVDGFGNTTTVTRDGGGHPSGILGPYGQTTALAAGADGWLTALASPAGESLAWGYAPGKPGLVTSFTDAAGATTSVGYDGSGRVLSVQGPTGGSVALSLEGAGSAVRQRTVTAKTGLGVSTTYQVEWDEQGEETRTVARPGGELGTERTGQDAVTTTTLPSGVVRTVTESGDTRFGMLAPFEAAVRVETPKGLRFDQVTTRSVTLAEADPFGLVKISQETVDPVTYTSYTVNYFASSRSWQLRTPSWRTRALALHPSGLLASRQTGTLAAVTDPLGRVTHYERDAAGRVTLEQLPDGQLVAFGYDAAGRPASLAPPGRPAHQLAWTALGLLQQYVEPAVDGIAPVTSYGYDADGRLTGVTRADGTSVAVARDGAGRPSGATFPGGSLAFSYELATGMLSSASGPEAEGIGFEYDGFLLKKATSAGPVAGTVRWGHDRFFKVVSEGVEGGDTNHVVTFAYDADGLMVKAGRMSIAQNPNGLLAGTSLGGLTETIWYDAVGLRTTQAASYQGTPQLSASYTRDLLGRITARTETILGQKLTTAFAYDLRGRLTKVTQGGVVVAQYGYDANGNRTSTTTPGKSSAASYDAQDRLVADGTRVYSYGAGR